MTDIPTETGHPAQASSVPSQHAAARGMPPRGADVIPFRPRLRAAQLPPARATPAAGAPPQAQERLARALEALNAAMADQRAAMAQWRNTLAALKTSTAGLGDSLQRYQANLASLGHGIAALRMQARSLQTWADNAGAAD